MRRTARLAIVLLMAALVLPAPAFAGLAATPWPMFRHDAARTGRSAYAGSPIGRVKWSYKTGAGVVSSPAIGSGGVIYFGSRDGKIYALNPNGTLKWSFNTGNQVVCSPAIGSDGTIYVGSGDQKIYALNPNGTQKWSYATGAWVGGLGPAIGTDGTIYFNNASGKLIAMNPNGTRRWQYASTGMASPAIGSAGVLFVGNGGNKLLALNPTGTVKWAYTGGIEMGAPAIGRDGTIYVPSGPDNHLNAIGPTGTKKWVFAAAGGIYASPGIGPDGTIYITSVDSKLYAIAATGGRKWSLTTGGPNVSAPTIGADGTIFFGSGDRKVYAVRPNGTVKWSVATGGMVNSSPVIAADGTVYAGSEDGSLYAIAPRTTSISLAGATRFETSIKASKAAFATGSCDSVIVATGRNYPDALAAAGLAGVVSCPIILVDGGATTIDYASTAELQRLTSGKTSRKIYIAGGTAAVSSGIEGALKRTFGTTNVVRLWGARRYDTAEAIAKKAVSLMPSRGVTYSGKAIVVTGADYHDALLAAPASFRSKTPILLVAGSVDSSLTSAMAAMHVTDAYIIGSTTLVPPAVQTGLGVALGATHVTRPCSAGDPYAMSVAVAGWDESEFSFGWNGVGIATGVNYPDALSAGPVMGKAGAPLLFSPAATLDSRIANALSAHKASIDVLRFFGGTSALSQAVRDAVVTTVE